ncbi:MAG: capsule assembly Wzi family protein [Myxococcota bacterium]
MLAVAAAFAADPWADPVADRVAREARREGHDTLLGDGETAPHELAERGDVGELPEALRGEWAPVWAFRPYTRASGGDAVPDNLSGDTEPGYLTWVAGAEGALYAGPLVARVAPEAEVGLFEGFDEEARFQTLWGGVDTGAIEAGFGKRDRWYGPGRHGALVLSSNADAPWLGTASAEGRLPGWFDRLGRFRAEAGAGWLGRPRDDVERPGLLLMDLRWSPVPAFELGATRLSLFGGVGRPPVDFGQLLVPTEPHVYDDPDLSEPDQNELAALDFRLCVPLRKWWALPVDHVEVWWQYGGEDVIGRKAGPIPYPSLAGVGNLYGGEVATGPVVVTVEYTRLMDDYFRWYVGHRVYHDGFTQDGRVLGHFGGPDSETLFAAVAVEGSRARVRLWGDTVRRVGVIGVLRDKVFTFPEEEHRLRGAIDAQVAVSPAARLGGGALVEDVTGEDFVPGADALRVRVWLGVEARVGGRLARD